MASLQKNALFFPLLGGVEFYTFFNPSQKNQEAIRKSRNFRSLLHRVKIFLLFSSEAPNKINFIKILSDGVSGIIEFFGGIFLLFIESTYRSIFSDFMGVIFEQTIGGGGNIFTDILGDIIISITEDIVKNIFGKYKIRFI